ncbi:MAG: type I-E CRISPR-associated protein Cas7/Cse4/CasC, partial [Caulobacteraceae bacterium]|nr:type I-E CRISPR-associated protein Cas7/Cse4/CasC [Caulobacteraceae bacterium]
MAEPRFLQIHFLAPYTAALLNRDDAGLAKRLPYGGHLRTRISSQCLKRHWRLAEDKHALGKVTVDANSYRSRETVDRKILADLSIETPEAVLKPIRDALLTAVYGEKGTDKKSRQPLILGAPEVAYLAAEARRLVERAGGDAKAAQEAAKDWQKSAKENLSAMRKSIALPGGLTAALFGRMVTSD